ncbi:MAG: alpha-hydroxy-acid oxidizing protein [Myxococcales bacterium]|nr:alpha-hydroxy-acid oxidizing protein [Myxococcales bacterium]
MTRSDRPSPLFAQRRLARCHSIADLRRAARRRLPRAAFDYADGGAEDEVTLARNESAFDAYALLPRTLVDVSEVDLSTQVLGQTCALPLVLAPTGLTRLFHHEGEHAVARAARSAGVPYTLSSLSTTSIEDLAAAVPGPHWFQVYVWRDRGLVREFFARCRASGYSTLCLTVDTPTLGQRERDLHNGMTIPPRLTLGALADAALRPAWCWKFLTTRRIRFENVRGAGDADAGDLTTLWGYITEQFDASLDWDDLAWMVQEWNGPFAIKGVLRGEDAVRAAALGVRAVIVSNHGGRQLDHAAAALDVLPEIAAAVGDRAELILDGGVRRGTDVLKALALGARACMIGRPYLYGLGAGGEAGVSRALDLLRAELRRALMLIGAPSVRALEPGFVRRSAAHPA